MTTEAFLEIVKQYGLGAAVLIVVGYGLWKGSRFIGTLIEKFFSSLIEQLKALRTEIDGVRDAVRIEAAALRGEINAHTTTDVEHHNEVKEGVARLDEKFDTILDRTPVVGVPIHRKARDAPR